MKAADTDWPLRASTHIIARWKNMESRTIDETQISGRETFCSEAAAKPLKSFYSFI